MSLEERILEMLTLFVDKREPKQVEKHKDDDITVILLYLCIMQKKKEYIYLFLPYSLIKEDLIKHKLKTLLSSIHSGLMKNMVINITVNLWIHS
jgi:hypothetical protein